MSLIVLKQFFIEIIKIKTKYINKVQNQMLTPSLYNIQKSQGKHMIFLYLCNQEINMYHM